jgi:putative hemolysin
MSVPALIPAGAPALLAAASIDALWSGGVIFLLTLLSACFAGSEAVLFSLTPLQLQSNSRSPSPLRRLSAQLMTRPKRVLTMILVGNTAVNVGIFATTYVLLRGLSSEAYPWIPAVGGGASVLLVLLLGDAFPKVLGVAAADRFTPGCAAFVHVTGYVLGPVGFVIDRFFAAPLTRLLEPHREDGDRNEHEVSQVELKTLLEMSRMHGVIDPIETDFLREVINLSVLQVRDVMVPRVEVQVYDVDAPPDGLRDLMRQTRRKKIPVYERAVDNIIGLVYAKVLFFSPNRPLRELVQPVRFVPAIITCEQLLQHFRGTRTQLAIVVDEFGGMAGLVTLEDVTEQIVGEIRGPDEPAEEPEIEQVSENEYDVSGRLSARYWAQAFGMPHRADRVATVGGLVVARLGRPARLGDKVRIGNVDLRVTRMQGRRVQRLRISMLDPATASVASRGKA